MSAQSDKEEKKKGAAPVPLGSGGSGASFSLEQLESLQFTLSQTSATAAATTASATAALVSKAVMLVLVTMLGAGAMNMRHANELPKTGIARPSAPAEKPKYEGDLSNLPTKPQDQPALQDVVVGDMARKGEDDAAAKAAADAAAAAEAEKQAQAQKEKDEAGKAAKAASATPAMAAGDLTAKAAKMPQAKKAFNKSFGQLSSSLGGGSGLSGGIGGSFQRPLTASAAPGASRGMGASPAPRGGGATKAIGSGRGGRAFRQLQNANALSRAAAHTSGEAAAQGASGAFDNNRGGGSPITGGGAGITGIGTHTGGADTRPNQGGPIGSGAGNGDGTSAPPESGHSNATPWQTFVDIAKWAMLAAVALMLAAYILAQHAKAIAAANALDGGVAAAPWFMAAKICAGLAIAAALTVTTMGLIVMGQGQMMQGGLFAAGGAAVGVLAYLQLTSAIDQSNAAKANLWAGPDQVGPMSNSVVDPSALGGGSLGSGDSAGVTALA
jgi:hypothetical protein